MIVYAIVPKEDYDQFPFQYTQQLADTCRWNEPETSFIISFTASETPLTGEDTGLFSEYNKLTHVEILQELRGEEWLPVDVE